MLIDREKLLADIGEYLTANGYALSSPQNRDTYYALSGVTDIIKNQPNAYDVDKVVERLKVRTAFLHGRKKYGSRVAVWRSEAYETMMMYEVADLVEDMIDIVKDGE